MLWGWIIGSFFTIIVSLCMAEICSVYPSAGSVYHWAGQLAKKEHVAFASYCTGWWNFLGNAAGDASFANGFAYVVLSAVLLNTSWNPTTTQLNGATVGVSLAVMTMWAVINILRIDQQGWLNVVAAIYQVISSVVIVIAILTSAQSGRADGNWVATAYYNNTGLGDSRGETFYVIIIGLLTTLFTFSGYEAGGHVILFPFLVSFLKVSFS